MSIPSTVYKLYSYQLDPDTADDPSGSPSRHSSTAVCLDTFGLPPVICLPQPLDIRLLDGWVSHLHGRSSLKPCCWQVVEVLGSGMTGPAVLSSITHTGMKASPIDAAMAASQRETAAGLKAGKLDEAGNPVSAAADAAAYTHCAQCGLDLTDDTGQPSPNPCPTCGEENSIEEAASNA